MAVAKEDVVSFIDNMTVLEMSEFVKELEEKYGVTAAVPTMAVAAAPGAAATAAADAESRLRTAESEYESLRAQTQSDALDEQYDDQKWSVVVFPCVSGDGVPSAPICYHKARNIIFIVSFN